MEEKALPPIYDAVLTFRKTGGGSKIVGIHIRYSKKGPQKRGDCPSQRT